MGSKFAYALKELLPKDECLEELYLSWNEINDKGARQIFEGLEKNNYLKVFDYSWNHIDYSATNSLIKGISFIS